MCQYKDFCLKDDMKRSIHLKSLVPPDEDLTPAFFKRNPESKWKGKFKKKKLKWSAFEWKDKDNNVRIRIDKMIELREFINQYGFVSSFAHQINCFVKKHSPTRIQNVQLHYMALLQTSQIQFYYVLGKMIDKEKGTYKGKNVFKKYQEEVKLLKLVLNGGPRPRVHPPSLHKYTFLSDETLFTEILET